MTNAETIEFIREKIQIDVSVLTEEEVQTTIDVLNMAISALEKQEQKKPLTNGDRIRAMTDEEMAKLILPVPCPPSRWHMDEFGARYTECPSEERIHGCHSCWLDWLKQEVKDGH